MSFVFLALETLIFIYQLWNDPESRWGVTLVFLYVVVRHVFRCSVQCLWRRWMWVNYRQRWRESLINILCVAKEFYNCSAQKQTGKLIIVVPLQGGSSCWRRWTVCGRSWCTASARCWRTSSKCLCPATTEATWTSPQPVLLWKSRPWRAGRTTWVRNTEKHMQRHNKDFLLPTLAQILFLFSLLWVAECCSCNLEITRSASFCLTK